jgi:hypothetical protein
LAAKLTHWRIDIKGAAGLFAGAEGFVGGQGDKEVVGVWDAAIKAARENIEKEAEEKKKAEEPVEEEASDEAQPAE